MAIFSLLTTFTATFAWFMSRRQVNNDADDFNVKVTPGLLETITFHQLTDTNGKTMVYENGVSRPSQYRFNKTPIGTLTYNWNSSSQSIQYATGYTKMALDRYTSLDQEHPILLIITFKEEINASAGTIEVVGHSLVNHYLGEKKPNGDPYCSLTGSVYNSGAEDANEMIRKQEAVLEDGNPKLNAFDEPIYRNWFPLSSAAKFQYAELSGTGNSYEGQLSIDDITTETAYQFDLTASENTSELKTGDSFIKITNGELTKNFNPNTIIYSSSEGKKIKHLALVIDYYAEAIEYIYSTYLGNSYLEEDYEGILDFLCDWSLEI